ncbi:MAG: ABC transporter permease subunit, partial [Clostridia bacterium]|nr:ABC transporter permease subunit [Clostridia bacterium]
RGKLLDKLIQVVTTALVSMPNFVIATLLLIIFGLKLKWAPTMATQEGGMILPALSLALYPMSYITRLERSAMLDVLGQDYIRTARAKGLANKKVIFKHALKNSMGPVITYAGPMMAYILTGSMVVENIFSVPGLGRLFVNSMLRTDYMMIMGVTIVLAVAIIVMNFLADVLYKVIDGQSHTSQSGWEPENAPSVWLAIDETHEGIFNDPIPAVSGMNYEKDKYYVYNGTLYLCIRQDSEDGTVLQFTPDQLVGQFFEIVSK